MPTTGSCLLEGSPYVSPNDVAVGVRSECIVGVAEVGVGYAVLLGLHEALTCGVDVGVEVGMEDGPLDMP
jgi:hypothetical protein